MAETFTDEERLHLREAYRPEGLGSEFARNIGRDKYNYALRSEQDIVNEDLDPAKRAAQPLIGDVEGGLMRSSAALGGDHMYNEALSRALGSRARSTYARGETDVKRQLEADAPNKRSARLAEAANYMGHAEEVRQDEAQRRQSIEDSIHAINMQKAASRAGVIKGVFTAVGAVAGAVVGTIVAPGAGTAAGGAVGAGAGSVAGNAATGGKSNYQYKRGGMPNA